MKALANKRRKRTSGRFRTTKRSDVDIIVKLNELLQGEREVLKIYSKFLHSEVYLVNAALRAPETLQFNRPVYTTKELALLVAMSAEELRRYHYLKQKLIERSVDP